MRALVWQGPFTVEVDAVDAPEPAAGEVLVAPAVVGICGSDVTAYKGKMGTARPGAIRGHEFGGTIARSSSESPAVGARVAVDPVVPCGSCPQCERGEPTSCSRVEIIGVHRPGALAELVAVPATQIHPLPDALDWLDAASAEPLAQAIHDVELARAGGRALGACLVIGGGSIGSWIVTAIAKGLGRAGGSEATRLTAVDTDRSRHPLLSALGADEVCADLGALGTKRFDTVIDAVGNAATRRRAVELAANGGLVVAVGLGADESAIPWFELTRREITVRGANVFRAEEYALALRALASGRAELLQRSEPIPLGDTAAAFERLASDGAGSGKVFVSPQT